jgi:predicted phage gp36 major capsid-like protein
VGRVPSGGWREVYEWCHVSVPMTLHREPQVRARVEAAQHKAMNQADSARKEVEQVRNRLERVRFDVADALDADDLDEIEEQIVQAGAELADIRAEVRSIKQGGAER